MTTRIKFELVGDGAGFHLLIPVIFNRKINGYLIIDTGASKSVFDKSLTGAFAAPLDAKEYLERFPQEDMKESLPPELLEQMNVNEGEILTMGVDSSSNIQTSFAFLESLKIGRLLIENLMIVQIDLSNVNKVFEMMLNKKIWGLLGSDLMVKYNAKIDYKKQSLTLFY